jgi:DNA-binding NtrC family response regulator
MPFTNVNNPKRRILIVDDEPEILLALSIILEGQGHYVKTFDKPVEALSHCRSIFGSNKFSCSR